MDADEQRSAEAESDRHRDIRVDQTIGRAQKTIGHFLSDLPYGSPQELIALVSGTIFAKNPAIGAFSPLIEYFSELVLRFTSEKRSMSELDAILTVEHISRLVAPVMSLAIMSVQLPPDPLDQTLSVAGLIAPHLKGFRSARWVLENWELGRDLLGLTGHDPSDPFATPLMPGKLSHPYTAKPDAIINEFDQEVISLCGGTPRALTFIAGIVMEKQISLFRSRPFAKHLGRGRRRSQRSKSQFFDMLSFDTDDIRQLAQEQLRSNYPMVHSTLGPGLDSFLQSFTSSFDDFKGRPPKAFELLTTSVLLDRPILQHDGRFLVPQPFQLPHAIIRRIADRIDQNDHLAERWKKVRASWLEDETQRFLDYGARRKVASDKGLAASASGPDRIWTNVSWSAPALQRRVGESRQPVNGEIDVLVDFGGFSILSECKSGRVRSGSSTEIERSLNRLFLEPSEQLERIRSVSLTPAIESVVFGGPAVEEDPKTATRLRQALQSPLRIELIVTFEDFGTIGLELPMILRRWSPTLPIKPPMILSLNDLRRIVRELQGVRLINYLHQRRECRGRKWMQDSGWGELSEEMLVERYLENGHIAIKTRAEQEFDLKISGRRGTASSDDPKHSLRGLTRDQAAYLLDQLETHRPTNFAAAACAVNVLMEDGVASSEIARIISGKESQHGVFALLPHYPELGIYLTQDKGFDDATLWGLVGAAIRRAVTEEGLPGPPSSLLALVVPRSSEAPPKVLTRGDLQSALFREPVGGWRDPLADIVWAQTGRRVRKPTGPAPVDRISTTTKGRGRNGPCPCGSGLKFKRCCLDSAE